MSIELTILVGTMTGTAEIVAEEIADELGAAGHGAEVVVMDGLDASVFGRPGVFLVCSSTYGQGDVPDNALKLYDDLQETRPDLSGLRFGVVALGDRTYADTYCNGGRRFDEILRALGAERIGEVFEHDASSGIIPEEAAVEWAQGWVELAAVAGVEAA